MTDTDLFTAGGSDDVALPETVASQAPEPASAPAPKSAASEASAAAAPPAASAPSTSGRTGALTSMVLPDLRAMATELGVKGSSGMRKGELIAAIREHRGDSNGRTKEAKATEQPVEPAKDQAGADAGTDAPAEQAAPPRRERRGASRRTGAPAAEAAAGEAVATESGTPEPKSEPKSEPKTESRSEPKTQDKREAKSEDKAEVTAEAKSATKDETKADDSGQSATGAEGNEPRRGQGNREDQGDRNSGNNSGGNRGNRNNDGGNRRNNSNDNNDDGGNRRNNDSGNRGNTNNNDDDDDGEGRQGRRGRRFRDRKRRGERGGEGGGGGDRDTELREDDVVQPVAGILDVLDNYAFVRTSGYLAGPNDVYVSMNMVRKNGLRRGDAVTGAVRVPREGETSGGGGGSQNPRQKFNPLVRLDTINGGPVENARNRPDFNKLTPLYPNQRLRLETTPEKLTTRVIDLIMPIGKGQRALIVSPPKAGKTTIMQDIANAITVNNPECHLMVVLVDERPEEVTDMQRSVKGEVIASTFDRPPSDHTQAAELAIERAKRLVEQGKDVVVLLDSITRLGRAYNNASPASGRILSGGVDSTALYPPKRFLGAARNIEFGGSLTIIATAMVETGSTGDTVIFEEFKGTGNAELKLDRKISERRVFPAVDVNPSGTRKDELLLSADEFGVVHKLRRVLSGLDSHQAIDLLMSQLRKTKTNYEFLVQVSKTTPANMDND
ncbi:transcription termination factor Rho [Mycolicibacterium sp. YH-1]|uniref:transcription termination factor Rho n=1 Tax=Mycolicibacterium sp. YH-1 TaxID=2908837 RepID=UPI001F4C0219|nr:transcription termination factor Rho [Mycolicibacterium sp. YH-1]UNB54491.1 transcription termination factor Rho [Mycolicibacterium sp. YH-1]